MSAAAGSDGTLHIGIMGAGAIGLYVGGMLASAGARVTFAARGRTLDALSRGLAVTRIGGFKAELKPERYRAGGVSGACRLQCHPVLHQIRRHREWPRGS
jgi:2-dehydropantoate 2-reductase